MIKWDIKTHLRVITFVPLALISIFFSGWFYYLRHIDLEAGLHERGDAFIRQLVPASEYGLLSRNQSLLQALANTAVGNTSIKAVTFYDKSRNAIAYQGPDKFLQARLPQSGKTLYHVQMQQIGKHTLNYIAPVILPGFNNYSAGFRNQANVSLPMKLNNHIIGWISVDFDGTQVQIRQYQALLISLLISLLGIIIAGIISNSLLSHITDPVRNIGKAINRALIGKYSGRIQSTGSGDFKVINDGLNQLINKLRGAEDDYQQQLLQNTSDLQHNIEALETKNIELDLSRKDALEKNRIKSEFIANMSHEIRTPMNGVIGFTNLLLETHLTPPQKEYLHTIKKSANNLLEIINDILDFSKIEAGKLQLDNIPMDIRECVEDVLTMLAPTAHPKRIELSPLIYSDVPLKVIGDPLRLKQIITNLVGNAIKFTNEGSVTVTVSRQVSDDDHIRLKVEVTDTGIGLSEKEQNNLFNAFRQADPSTARKYGGTGLGLVICEKLVQQMGGKVGIESQEGAGSTFWFTFVSDQISSATGSTIEYVSLSNIKVLLYEQHQKTRAGLAEMLKLWKMQLTNTDTSNDLIKRLKKSSDSFDLIMLGLTEFEQDSIQQQGSVLETVRKMAPHVPVIMFVNTTNPELNYSLFNSGTSLYLSKPINHKKLYHALGDLLFLKKSPPHMVFGNKHYLPSKKKIKLLIVEDNTTNLLLFTSLVDGMNAKVITASDGLEGVRLTEQSSFDLIILDLQLPNMNGIEATTRIRQQKNVNQNTPIIIISAFITRVDRKRLKAAGVNDILLKPIDRDTMHQVISRWINEVAKPTTSPNQEMTFDTKPTLEPTNNTIELHSSYPIDWALCLKHAAHNESAANEILQKIIDDLPATKSLIDKAYQAKNFTELKTIIHKVHGGCCYSGLPNLKNLSAEIEQSLENEETAQLTMLIDSIQTAMDQILDDYQAQDYKQRVNTEEV